MQKISNGEIKKLSVRKKGIGLEIKIHGWKDQSSIKLKNENIVF